jgi:hypothetical protein
MGQWGMDDDAVVAYSSAFGAWNAEVQAVVHASIRRRHAVLEDQCERALWLTDPDRWGHLHVHSVVGAPDPWAEDIIGSVACSWPDPIPNHVEAGS